HDIDLVVAMPASAAKDLVKAFPPPDYYLTEEAILDGIRGRSMFNLLALSQGDKVDFWILKDEPLDQSRFARKRQVNVLGIPLNISAPEDTILAKLWWIQEAGGSEKQFTDALRVYEVQRGKLDHDYLNHWATLLGVASLWERLKAAAEPV